MPKEKVTRAAGYIRRSDMRNERNFSLEFQREKIIGHCRLLKVPIRDDHIFVDRYTGSVWRERKGLQELLAAAKRHEFDILVVDRLDRLSRDHTDQIVIREQLKYYGVTIVTLDPDEHADDESPLGAVIRSGYGFQAEVERKKILERIEDGRQQRVKDGHIIPGNAPLYGYLWEDTIVMKNGQQVVIPKSHYVFDPTIVWIDLDGSPWTKRDVVMWMFDRARNGMSLRGIARELTYRGIPTPSGNKIWKFNTVLWILTHPYYKGQVAVFKRKQEYIDGVGYKRSMRPESEWKVLAEGVVPAMVDEITWNDVQRRLAQNKEHSPRNLRDKEESLMRGLVFCGYCKSKMIFAPPTQKNDLSYRCHKVRDGYRGMQECNNGTIVVRKVDEAAWEEAKSIIAAPEILHQRQMARVREDPNQDELVSVENLILEKLPVIQNLTETIETMEASAAREVLIGRLNMLAEEKLKLEERRDKLNRHAINMQAVEKSWMEFLVWCDEFRQDMTQEVSNERKRTAIQKIGIYAVVYRHDHKPRFEVDTAPPEMMELLYPGEFIYLTGRNLRS